MDLVGTSTPEMSPHFRSPDSLLGSTYMYTYKPWTARYFQELIDVDVQVVFVKSYPQHLGCCHVEGGAFYIKFDRSSCV